MIKMYSEQIKKTRRN